MNRFATIPSAGILAASKFPKPNADFRKLTSIIVLVWMLAGMPAVGQENTPRTNSQPVGMEEKAEKAWSFSAAAYTYIVPENRDYVQPTISADHHWLHLEARYNYEALETGSTWVGYNFSGGKEITWEVTPMLGGVFGEQNGIALGYKGSLSWWKLNLYSEGEYVFDIGDSSESFFYNWSELALAPVEWFRFGLATQRTRAYQTDRELHRGPLVGFSYKVIDISAYAFDLDESKPTFVFSAGVKF